MFMSVYKNKMYDPRTFVVTEVGGKIAGVLLNLRNYEVVWTDENNVMCMIACRIDPQ